MYLDLLLSFLKMENHINWFFVPYERSPLQLWTRWSHKMKLIFKQIVHSFIFACVRFLTFIKTMFHIMLSWIVSYMARILHTPFISFCNSQGAHSRRVHIYLNANTQSYRYSFYTWPVLVKLGLNFPVLVVVVSALEQYCLWCVCCVLYLSFSLPLPLYVYILL